MTTPTDVRITIGNITTNVVNLVAANVIEVNDPLADIPELVRELAKSMLDVQADLVGQYADEADKPKGGGSGNRRSSSNGGRSSGYSGQRGSSGSSYRKGGQGRNDDAPATDKQIAYAIDLGADPDEVEGMTRGEISKVIEDLK